PARVTRMRTPAPLERPRNTRSPTFETRTCLSSRADCSMVIPILESGSGGRRMDPPPPLLVVQPSATVTRSIDLATGSLPPAALGGGPADGARAARPPSGPAPPQHP